MAPREHVQPGVTCVPGPALGTGCPGRGLFQFPGAPHVPGCPQVRLLTGIGRYNEMTYIFELLHQKHYFEVLMRKKLDPVREGQTCRELCGCIRNWCLDRVELSGHFTS